MCKEFQTKIVAIEYEFKLSAAQRTIQVDGINIGVAEPRGRTRHGWLYERVISILPGAKVEVLAPKGASVEVS